MKNWKALKSFFRYLVKKVRAIFSKLGIAHAAIIVGEKIRDGIAQLKHKLFYKEDGKWMEETTSCEILYEEVPPRIRAKIAYREADITREMELELGMTI